MSLIIESHECTLSAVVRPDVSYEPGEEFHGRVHVWQCTHVNLDGVPCGTVVTGYALPYCGAKTHVTTSEAVTRWMQKTKVD